MRLLAEQLAGCSGNASNVAVSTKVVERSDVLLKNAAGINVVTSVYVVDTTERKEKILLGKIWMKQEVYYYHTIKHVIRFFLMRPLLKVI